jgi:hypothetical protein
VDATAELASLVEARDQASAKVDALEREAHTAGQTLAQTREALAEFERRGGRQAERTKLEQAFAEAEAKTREPWLVRIDGGRRAVRDAQRRIREHVSANLLELLDAVEADGRVAAARVDAAAQELFDANHAAQAVAARIGSLITKVQPPQPGDVSFTRSDEAARAAAALLASGGETPPSLDRSRAPWLALLGGEAEVVDVEDAAVA